MTRWRSASSPPTSIPTTTRSPRSGGAFCKQIEKLFVQVLVLAREMGVLKMGTVALDGTKIHANASRHSALSYEHAGKIEAQLQAEVAELHGPRRGGGSGGRAGRDVDPRGTGAAREAPGEARRARATIEARAKERHAREQAEHEAKLAARDGQDRGHRQEARRQAARSRRWRDLARPIRST